MLSTSSSAYHPHRAFRYLRLLCCHIVIVVFDGASWGANIGADAETEVSRIKAELDHAVELAGTAPSLEATLVSFSRIGASLDVFEMRYGVQPTSVNGWDGVQNAARALLPHFRKLAKRGLYFDQDSAATANAILLELAGKPKEAMAALEKIEPGGGCGNWIATVMMAVAERQSGISQRMGDYQAALDYLEAAVSQEGLSLYHPNGDLQLARRGFLLAKVGRKDDAIASYHRAVDLYPRSTADELARRELVQLQRLIEPTADRIVQLYLTGSGENESTDPAAAILALAKHRFPESYAILSSRLETADVWERNRLVPALGILGDPAALSLLRAIVRKGEDVATCAHALRSPYTDYDSHGAPKDATL